MLQLKAFYEAFKAYLYSAIVLAAFCIGWYFCSLSYKADIKEEQRIAAETARVLQVQLADIQSKYDELKGKVTIEQVTTTVYVDRWKVKKECRVTNAFQQIHDNSALGLSNLPPVDFVDNYNDITCEQAAKVIRWNYLEASKKDAQIIGLQEVVTHLKDAIERVGK